MEPVRCGMDCETALAQMARCGTTSATFFELLGPRGLVDGTGASDIFQLFCDLANVRDWALIGSATSAPDRLAALAFRQGEDVRAVVANLIAEPVEFTWNSAVGVDDNEIFVVGAYEVVWCDVDAASRSRR